jgi:hypothetical protein
VSIDNSRWCAINQRFIDRGVHTMMMTKKKQQQPGAAGVNIQWEREMKNPATTEKKSESKLPNL